MALPVLLAPLFSITEDKRALDAAFILAKRFQSHVDALFVHLDPADSIPLVGEEASTDSVKRLMEGAVAMIEERKRAATTVFEKAASAAEIPMIEPATASSTRPSASFLDAIGRSEIVVPEQALVADLVVFGKAWSDAASALRATFEVVLLKSRCPILLTPVEPVTDIGRHVAVAWNGTPEAKSALSAAMPFLTGAVAVHLVTAARSRSEPDGLAGVRNYLAWHGIRCQTHAVDAGHESVGAALMRKAAAIGADLLVMGGYGHMRFRERILDGVTHHIVHQPALPVLLAH